MFDLEHDADVGRQIQTLTVWQCEELIIIKDAE
jgi:hypothetical protein